VAPRTNVLVSTPCHRTPSVRLALRRRADTLHRTAGQAVRAPGLGGRSAPAHAADATPPTPPAPRPGVDGVKAILHGSRQAPPAAHPRRLHRPDRWPGVPLRAEPLGAVPTAGRTHRFAHARAGGLDPSSPETGHERSCPVEMAPL
jgi:hypothetical protein